MRKKRFMLGKLTVLLGLTALMIDPALADPALLPAPAPTTIRNVFDITRDGNKIGTDIVEIEKQGDTTNVKFTTEISVVIMFVEAYRYEHSGLETWTGGQFTSFKSQTNDGGTKHNVVATLVGDKINLMSDGKRSEVPRTVVPASLWNKAFIDHPALFDAETGAPISIQVKDMGDEPFVFHGAKIKARHYKITGDIERDFWFDGDKLLRMKMLGSDHSTIVSELQP